MVPSAIARATARANRRTSFEESRITEILREVADSFFDEVIALRQAEELRFRRAAGEGINLATVNKYVLENTRRRWESSRMELVPGKAVLSHIRSRLSDQKIRPPKAQEILAAMAEADVDREVVEYLRMIGAAIRAS